MNLEEKINKNNEMVMDLGILQNERLRVIEEADRAKEEGKFDLYTEKCHLKNSLSTKIDELQTKINNLWK